MIPGVVRWNYAYLFPVEDSRFLLFVLLILEKRAKARGTKGRRQAAAAEKQTHARTGDLVFEKTHMLGVMGDSHLRRCAEEYDTATAVQQLHACVCT